MLQATGPNLQKEAHIVQVLIAGINKRFHGTCMEKIEKGVCINVKNQEVME